MKVLGVNFFLKHSVEPCCIFSANPQVPAAYRRNCGAVRCVTLKSLRNDGNYAWQTAGVARFLRLWSPNFQGHILVHNQEAVLFSTFQGHLLTIKKPQFYANLMDTLIVLAESPESGNLDSLAGHAPD